MAPAALRGGLALPWGLLSRTQQEGLRWAVRWLLCFPVRAPESRYVGFGNTVPPPKKEDDFLNSAMSSLYSVSAPSRGRRPPHLCGPPPCLGVSFRSRSFHSFTYFGNKHTFQVNKEHFLRRTNILCGSGIAWPGPAHVGPHAALLTSLGKMRFGGRVSKLPGSSTLWGWHPQPCMVPAC